MSSNRPIIPIYTTRGDVGAFLVYPYLYNAQGDWIGFITTAKKVYSTLGFYVGWLSEDARIFRKRSGDSDEPRLIPPPAPRRFIPPSSVPLPGMMSELSFGIVDVLEDEPELLIYPDMESKREDMD